MGESEDREDAAKWRFLAWAARNPVVTGLLCFCLGGSGGTFLSHRTPDPRIDQVLSGQNEILHRVEVNSARIDNHETRLAFLEFKSDLLNVKRKGSK